MRHRNMERELSKQELEHLIVDLIKGTISVRDCHLFRHIPRASTVEYFPIATTIYILTEGGVKIENIIHNPDVSIAIHAPFAGWQTVRGIQITGTCRDREEGVQGYMKKVLMPSTNAGDK